MIRLSPSKGRKASMARTGAAISSKIPGFIHQAVVKLNEEQRRAAYQREVEEMRKKGVQCF